MNTNKTFLFFKIFYNNLNYRLFEINNFERFLNVIVYLIL